MTMAQQTVVSEEKNNNNATKNHCEEKEAEPDDNLKNLSHEVPKRTTRSKRLSKPKKEFDSLPFSKKHSKEEKPIHDGMLDNSIKKRVLWGCMDKSLFFDALLEHGKDFDAIQNFMSQKQKKRGDGEYNFKSKEQIRHFYYRTWHKICPFIHQSTSDESKKQTIELQGVLCYGEIRKKVVAKFDEKLGQKLNELVHKGSVILKLKGKKVVLRAPSCKVKKLHHQQTTDPSQLMKSLQSRKISVELMPRNNKSWSFVQGLSQNPRILISTRTTHNVADIINCLQLKWSQERTDIENKTKLKLYLPPNIKLHPTDFLPEHHQTKSGKIKNDLLHGLEANLPENKSCKLSENCNAAIVQPVQTNKHKPVISLADNNEDDEDDIGVHMEINDGDDDDRRSTNVDKERRDDDKESVKSCEPDEASRKLTNEGLDDITGGHVTIAKLLTILGCPEIVKLEYDWIEPTNELSCTENCPIISGEQVSNVMPAHAKTLPFASSPYFNSRIKRLLEIACTEYCAVSDQKNKDSKSKEIKSSSIPSAAGIDGFRVPDCIPPRASQSLKSSEKRIMDQDLLQQMAIFQKKPDIILTRRTRKKPIPKPPVTPTSQRPLVPKMCPMFQQEILTGNASSSQALGFSGIKDLMMLHAVAPSPLPSVVAPSSSSSLSSPTCLTSSSSSSKPSLITMEPSELKPSVRRIIPIILNKSTNEDTSNKLSPAVTTVQSSTISRVITGADVFLVSKMFEDSNDNPNNPKIIISAAVSGPQPSNATKGCDSFTHHKQTPVEEQWIPNEELSLPSFLQDMTTAIPQPSTSNAYPQFFSSESSRDSNHIAKFEDMQRIMDECSLDFASKFADIATDMALSTPTSTLSQMVNAPNQTGLMPSKLIT